MSNQTPEDIDFENSYVLVLNIAPYALEMRMDLLLLPQHPAYCTPKGAEQGCFRPGVLRIRQFKKLEWNASGFLPATDATGEMDWGCLDELHLRDDRWRIAGDWGVIEIEGGRLDIQVDAIAKEGGH